MVDLLDLCMWKWRSGRSLVREDKKLQDIHLVNFEGCAVAVGGWQADWEVGPWPDSSEEGVGSTAVSAYDVCADAWLELQPLPFAVNNACPVAVRMPSVLRV